MTALILEIINWLFFSGGITLDRSKHIKDLEDRLRYAGPYVLPGSGCQVLYFNLDDRVKE